MKEDSRETPEKNGMSRRTFMKNSGLVAGGLVGGGLLGGLLTNEFKPKEAKVPLKHISGGLQEARVYINRPADFQILSAATERLFPKDKLGPGAIELGVPYFIDKQLAGEWGSNAKEYMKGPFISNIKNAGTHNEEKSQDSQGPNADTQIPVPTPRYQTILTRGELFTIGLRRIDEVSREQFDMGFIELAPEEQDEVLKTFEDGKVEMKGVGSSNFFNLLLQTTIEGAYADPVYGGNKNMLGWKMKEYPGPQMSYLDKIEEEKFIVMKPQSLRDYQGH